LSVDGVEGVGVLRVTDSTGHLCALFEAGIRHRTLRARSGAVVAAVDADALRLLGDGEPAKLLGHCERVLSRIYKVAVFALERWLEEPSPEAPFPTVGEATLGALDAPNAMERTRGERVFHATDVPDALYVVLEGDVAVGRRSYGRGAVLGGLAPRGIPTDSEYGSGLDCSRNEMLKKTSSRRGKYGDPSNRPVPTKPRETSRTRRRNFDF